MLGLIKSVLLSVKISNVEQTIYLRQSILQAPTCVEVSRVHNAVPFKLWSCALSPQ